MFASTCLHCLDAASIGIGLANFGGVSMLFSVSAGDDPDPLAGDRTECFEDARAQSLFPCVDPDSTVIHVLLEISGREYGNGNAGRCAECIMADLPGHHCSALYLQSNLKDRCNGRDQKDAGQGIDR